MKNLFIYLLLFLNIGSNNFKIEGLRDNYYAYENIQFFLTNNSSSKKYYYIGVDYYDNKIWSELINDVSDSKSNKSLISVILPSKSVKINFSIKKTFYLDNFLNFKLYRLKIVCGDSKEKLEETYFSKGFKIVKCKN